MNKFAAAIILALLPLAGCAAPYGSSSGAWAYYDRDYDWGHDGYDRPMSYYGESADGLPYDNSAPPASGQVYGNVAPRPPVVAQSYSYYGDQTYRESGEVGRARPHRMRRCHCRSAPAHAIPHAQHDPSWFSTYYTIG